MHSYLSVFLAYQLMEVVRYDAARVFPTAKLKHTKVMPKKQAQVSSEQKTHDTDRTNMSVLFVRRVVVCKKLPANIK